MQNYLTKSQVRGLREKPIRAGEVFTADPRFVVRLVEIGALEATDLSATVDLEEADDIFPRDHYDPGTGIPLVAVNDRDALLTAIADLGGIVFFPGSGLPDLAAQALVDFSNDDLFVELDVRIGEGRLTLDDVLLRFARPAVDDQQVAPPAGETIQSGQDGAEGTDSGTPAVSDPAPSKAAPASTRKGKTAGK
ncbi:hypothetical protein SAMN02927924_01367 [Sphingobium faniae]|nr:hypothetical protein SAMN02927924_01367 [Sphingobium faniae]